MRNLMRAALALPLALALTQGLRAELACRNSDYRGVFGAVALGDFITPPPGIPAGPTVRIGRVEADGNGNASIRATLSLNGVIVREDYGGTYSINPDCTVNVTLLIPFPGAPAPIPFKFFGMLADDGRELGIILLEPAGTSVRITLRKQRHDDCANGDLSGGYLLNMSGVNAFLPNVAQGHFARLGRVKFDGKGAFTANTRVSYAGRIVEESFAGVYSVDSNCTVSMAYTLGQPFTWSGMIRDNSAAVDFMVSEPMGAAITGSLKQQ
jgi:hypothetical protein